MGLMFTWPGETGIRYWSPNTVHDLRHQGSISSTYSSSRAILFEDRSLLSDQDGPNIYSEADPLGKGAYIGGHSLITAKGRGWSYDPCEVKSPIVKKMRSSTQDEREGNTAVQKPSTKTKKQVAAEKARIKNYDLGRYAGRCALADKHGYPRPQRPPEVKKSWLRHEKQRNRFEKTVQEILLRMS